MPAMIVLYVYSRNDQYDHASLCDCNRNMVKTTENTEAYYHFLPMRMHRVNMLRGISTEIE